MERISRNLVPYTNDKRYRRFTKEVLHIDSSRKHWKIETSFWIFREDESRIGKGNGAENFAVLRHIALNLLKKQSQDWY